MGTEFRVRSEGGEEALTALSGCLAVEESEKLRWVESLQAEWKELWRGM